MLTLAIIKPDAVGAGKTGKILAHLEQAGFTIRAARLVKLSTAQAEAFYEVHRARPFYRPLVRFMTSGPGLALAGPLHAPAPVQPARDGRSDWRGARGTVVASEWRPSLRAVAGPLQAAIHASCTKHAGALEGPYSYPMPREATQIDLRPAL